MSQTYSDLNLTNFPDDLDTFPNLQDISASDVPTFNLYKTYISNGDVLSAQNLLQANPSLQNKIFSAINLNRITQGLLGVQRFFKDDVEGFINIKQTEFQAEIDKFDLIGNWSSTQQYYKKNLVSYNGNVYMAKKDSLNHAPTTGDIYDTYWLMLSRSGAKGDPGVSILYKGDYNNSTTYQIGDAVTYLNAIYYCKVASLGNLPTDTTYWQIADKIIVGSAPPSNPVLDMVWFDKTLNIFKIFNGTIWVNGSAYAITDGTLTFTPTDIKNMEDEITILSENLDTANTDISTLSADYTSFKNSKGQANGIAPLGADSKVDSQYLPNITPVDYGRYQSEFGFTNAVLNGCNLSSDLISLGTTIVNTWDLNSSMSTTQYYYAYLTPVNTRIYMIDTTNSKFAYYDINTNTLVENLPFQLCANLTAVGTKIYGRQTVSPYRMFIYDTTNNTWDITTGGTNSSVSGGFCSIDTKIYAVDGTGKIYIYDTTNNTWDTTTGATNSYIYNSKAIAIGTNIYYDCTGNTTYNTYMIVYDTVTNTFSQKTSAPLAKYFMSAIDTKIYAQNNTGTWPIYVYDTNTNTWDTTSTPLAVSGSQGGVTLSATVGRKIYSRTTVAPNYKIYIYTQDVNNLSGTVTKTITPSDLKKWGNLKWTQTIPTNTNVVCDILDNSHQDAIPTMTSNILPSGVTFASTEQTPAYMCFDNNLSTVWSASATTGYVGYQFPTAILSNGYSITAVSSTLVTRSPKNWTFEGSNDGSNWTVLQTVTNQTGWGVSEERQFNFGNNVSYKYYRLNVTSNNGDTLYLQIAELKIFPTTVLKSNVTSIADLSDIDIETYPSVRTQWTLTRNSITDTSPSVNDPSWTWEGANIGDGTWEKITEFDLINATQQVDFLNIDSKYKHIQLRGRLFYTSISSSVAIVLRFNNDSGSNYLIVTGANTSSTTTTSITVANALATAGYPYDSEFVVELYGLKTNKAKQGKLMTSYLYQVPPTLGGNYNQSFAWLNTVADISTISIISTNASLLLDAGSKLTLWGCK